MPVRTNQPTIMLALLITSAAALAGCTHSGTTGAARSSHGQPVGVNAIPSAIPDDAALRKNVTIYSCKASKDGWQALGTATNPDTKQTDYTVTVFFTTTSGTVIGTGQRTVTVKPGALQPWTINSTFNAPPDTRCVLRGVG